MADDPKKKADTLETSKAKTDGRDNQTKKPDGGDTHLKPGNDAETQQTYKSLRQKMREKDQGFSIAALKAPGSGSKFELTDGDKSVASAQQGKVAPREAMLPAPPVAHPASPAAQTGEKPVNMAEMTKDAEAIRKATGNDNMIARWADKEAINKILEGKTDAERKAVAQIYQQKYGTGLAAEIGSFEHGSDFDKFLNILNRQDNNTENQAARRIHQDLLENHNLLQGRSSALIEKDMRDLLSTHNADQVKKISDEYRTAYGVSLTDAIDKDSKISQATKDMVGIYMKGSDRRTDGDTAKLISIALDHKNTELFAESMRDASPTARKQFLDNGGEQKVEQAFGHWYSNDDVKHVMDYAREGKLSAATQVRDNTGLIFDNAQGVELAINRMSDSERKMYSDGKTLSENKSVAGMSPEDAGKARSYYDSLHGALAKVANPTEMIKYEGMIATKGGSSLITALAADRGMLFNASTEKIQEQIRNMTPEQLADSKAHPKRRQELDAMLGSLNKNDRDKRETLAIYDRMVAAKDIDQAREATKPSLTSELARAQHWYGDNPSQTLDAISNMSQADQAQYRTNEQFRSKINETITNVVEDPRMRDAANRMLAQVMAGKAPGSDVIAQMERVPNMDGENSTAIARELDNTLRADPELRERITHPKTDEERRFSELFKKTAHESFGDDYGTYGKPIVEQGRLSLDLKVGLNRGVFSNDYQQAFADIQNATPEEKQRLKQDPAYQEKVLGFMDINRRRIALATLDQTGLKPEDKIRAAVAGWGGSHDVVQELQGIKPEDLGRAKADYAKKYGSSLEGDLMAKLSGHERDLAERVLTQQLGVEARANIMRDQTEQARSGMGAALSDHVFRSGTGAQADDAVNQTNRLLSEQNKTDAAIASGNAVLQNMTPEQIQAMRTKLASQLDESLRVQATATDGHIDSKKAAATYVGDAAVMTLAVGSMVLTGGLDTPLVVGLAAAGAGIKVGTNMALEGNNYDYSAGNVATDGLTGSLSAATAAIGPGEIAAVFGIGRAAAGEAASGVLAETSEQLLANGASETLQRGTQDIVRETLASGAKKLNPADLTALAEKVVAPEVTGAAREAVVKEMADRLEKKVSENLASGVVRQATHHGLNVASGSVAGGVTGAADSATRWDSRRSLAENVGSVILATGEGAAGGAIIAGAMSTFTPALGRVFNRAAEGGEVRPLEPQAPPRGERPLAGDASTASPAAPPAERPAGAQAPTRTEKPRTSESATSAPEAVRKPEAERASEALQAPEVARGERPALAPESRWPRNEKSEVLDSKGNVFDQDWPKLKPHEIEPVRAQVRQELAQVKASSGDNVLAKLEGSGLSPIQQSRVLDALGEVREHYARTFKTDVDQPVNWIHTQGELGRVIDAARAAHLTPNETEDALLASMFSDSLKTKANFTTHHLDGELAADRILRDKLGGDFTPERLNGILHAVREHQIAPPVFMGMIYNGGIMRSIAADGRKATAEEELAIKSLRAKMNDPLRAQLADAPDGGKMLQLSDQERSLLKRAGVDNWYVPSDGTPWCKISRALIDGDGIDNYATPGGLSKIIQIRGPETAQYFGDSNFRYDNPDRVPGTAASSSQGSWRDSFNDFSKVASPDGLAVARGAVSDAEQSALAAQGRVDAWLHQRLNIPADQELPRIPGWTGHPKLGSDGLPELGADGRPIMEPDKLTYPQYEQRWWDIHNTPLAKRSAEDQTWYQNPANRYRNLTEQQISDFKLAQEIRDRYAVELRKEQRVAGDAAPDYQPVRGTEAPPRRTNGQGQILDSKNNVLENDWPRVPADSADRVRGQVRGELEQVKASDGGSVLRKLDNAGLSDEQKEHVLDALGEVREHYARTFNTDVDQRVNWIHTQGELGRVVDAAKAANATPQQMEDALLASMFSDSLKVKANFTTHHLDGELSAERILKEQLGGEFTQQRLDGILHAIKEHQIAPPGFMSLIYGMEVRGSFARDGIEMNDAQKAALKSLLGKIGDPLHSKLVDAPGGGKMLDLSPTERELLQRTGNDNWYVPSEGTPWSKISRALIDGDGIDNYATPGGMSKIIQIRGPETGPFFRDGNFRYENPGRKPGGFPSSSQESWRDSFKDFADVASPEGLAVAKSAARDAEQDALAAQARVDQWLHERLAIPAAEELPVIPGWSGKSVLDASGKPAIGENGLPVMQPDNLKYPDVPQKWWDIHRIPAAKRTPEQQAFYDDPANRYNGLSPEEIQQFNLAKEIRDRYAFELRKEQRVAGDSAPDYQPVVQPLAATAGAGTR
jgi:hypothetical protein